MKLTKAEKIWLAVVVIFYILYNLPFFPKYYMPKATILHMVITIIPLWIAIYIGFFKICRGKKKEFKASENKISESKNSENKTVSEVAGDISTNTHEKEDETC